MSVEEWVDREAKRMANLHTAGQREAAIKESLLATRGRVYERLVPILKHLAAHVEPLSGVFSVITQLDNAAVGLLEIQVAARELVRQIGINNFKDDLGHEAFRLRAFAELQRALSQRQEPTDA